MTSAAEMFFELSGKIASLSFPCMNFMLQVGISENYELPVKLITKTGRIDINGYLDLIAKYQHSSHKANNQSMLDYLIEIIGDSNINWQVRRKAALLINFLLNQEKMHHMKSWGFIETLIKRKFSEIFPIYVHEKTAFKAVESIIRLFKNNDPSIRRWALIAVSARKDLCLIESLIEMVYDDDRDVRRCVISQLGRKKFQHAIEPLITLLNHIDWETRFFAVRSLGKIGNSLAIEPLINLIKNDTEPYVRTAAINTLNEIDAKQCIESLIALFNSEQCDIGTKIQLANALALGGNQIAIKFLKNFDINNLPIDTLYILASTKCSFEIVNKLIVLLKNRKDKYWGRKYYLLERLFDNYPDIVEKALIYAFRNGEIDGGSVSEILRTVIRRPAAYLQYHHLKKSHKVFSYISSLASLDKISECCKTSLKIGVEAIIVRSKSKGKSVHALPCSEVKAAYWS